VCSVWFGFDKDLNIYWISTEAREHSKQIAINNKVAGAIVLPQTPKDKPRAIQFKGAAEQLTNKGDIAKAIGVYARRIFSVQQLREFMSSKDHPHKFYRVKPELFVLFDAVNFPEQSRQEYWVNKR
jgi:uncharacterized protein YhbP (UPF0306 family)